MEKNKKVHAIVLALVIVLAAVQIPGIVFANQPQNLADVLASSSKSVVVLGAEGAYVEAGTTVEIPSGKTVIVPYKDGIKRATQANGDSEDTLMADSAYSTLEIRDGAKLVVNGTLIVGSQSGPSGDAENAINGGYGEIVTGEGSILEINNTFQNYGIVSGNGELIANNGANVSDLFTIFNYRGGGYLTGVVMNKNVFPLNEYGCDNIKIKATYNYGSNLKGLAKVCVAIPENYQFILGEKEYCVIEFDCIGTEGIYKSPEGGSVVKEVIAESASEQEMSRETITFYGGGIMDESVLNINVMGIVNVDLNSKNFLFPVSGYTTIVVEDGIMEVNRGFKFMPGSNMIIREGATLLLDEEQDLTPGQYYFDESSMSADQSKCVDSSAYLLFYEGGEAEGTFGAAEKNITGTKYSAGFDTASLILEGDLVVQNKGYIAGNIESASGNVYLPCTMTEEELATPVTFTSYEANSAKSSPELVPVYTSTTWNDVANVTTNTHDVTEWTTTDATCTTEGVTEGFCHICEETVSIGIPSKGHKEEKVSAVAPTCTESGLTEGTKCSVCDVTLIAQEVIPELGHEWTDAVDIPPTCTEPGYASAAKCNRCGLVDGDEENITTPALGHTKVEIEAIAPTCTTAGRNAGTKCSVCDATIDGLEEVPATGHVEEIIPEDPATCLKGGYTEGVKCTVCEEILSGLEEIPVLDHKEEIIPGKLATCSQAGYTQGVKCAMCETVLSGLEELPALSPTLQHEEEVIAAVEPTCVQTGLTEGSKCVYCGEILKEQKEVPATDHSFEWEIVKEPSEYLQGLKSGTCAVCGKKEFEILGKVEAGNSDNTGNTGSSGSNNETSSNRSDNSGTDAAKTGDDARSIMYLGMCAVSLGVIVLVRRKRTEIA